MVGAHVTQSLIAVAGGGTVGGVAGFIIGRAIHRRLADNVGIIADTVLPGTVWAVAGAAVGVVLVAGLIASGLALRNRPGAVLRGNRPGND